MIEKLKNINWKDLLARVAKTFMQAFIGSFLATEGINNLFAGIGFETAKTLLMSAIIAGLSAGACAVWNMILAFLKTTVPEAAIVPFKPITDKDIDDSKEAEKPEIEVPADLPKKNEIPVVIPITPTPEKPVTQPIKIDRFLDVWEYQLNLLGLGYRIGEADGEKGTATYWGLRSFQFHYGQEFDGMYGDITNSVMIDQIARIQQIVGTDIDGVYGDGTKAAVAVWQAANGCPTADGIAVPSTLAAMGLCPGNLYDIYTAPNFSKSEFSCGCNWHGLYYCNGYPAGDPSFTLVTLLQHARNALGGAISITSGERCQTYNDSLSGSVPNSTHILGFAADTVMDGVSVSDLIDYYYSQPETEYSYDCGAAHVNVMC